MIVSLTLTEHQRAALDTAAHLEGRLRFAVTAPYQRHLRAPLRASEGSHRQWDRAVRAVDNLLFDVEYDDGTTVLDRFLGKHPEPAPVERELVTAWRDSVSGIFEVADRRDDMLLLDNLTDQLDHLSVSSMGAEAIATCRRPIPLPSIALEVD